MILQNPRMASPTPPLSLLPPSQHPPSKISPDPWTHYSVHLLDHTVVLEERSGAPGRLIVKGAEAQQLQELLENKKYKMKENYLTLSLDDMKICRLTW